MTDVTDITTEEHVAIYTATKSIFSGVLKEIRELSKKKPDAIMNSGKVKLINRVLEDLKKILEMEPESKFLDLLSDEELPQTSDAVLVMVQYETVLIAYKKKYYCVFKVDEYESRSFWVTPEFIKKCKKYGYEKR